MKAEAVPVWEKSWKIFLGEVPGAISFSAAKLTLTQHETEQVLADLKELSSLNFNSMIKTRFLTQPEFSNAKRAQQWLQSRKELAIAVRKTLNQGVLPQTIKLSLSHTRDATLAAVAQEIDIGVDLERADRPISEALAAKFYFESEKINSLSALQVWALKEACYKANPDQKTTVLSDYHLLNPETVEVQEKRIVCQTFQFQHWVLGFARLKGNHG